MNDNTTPNTIKAIPYEGTQNIDNNDSQGYAPVVKLDESQPDNHPARKGILSQLNDETDFAKGASNFLSEFSNMFVPEHAKNKIQETGIAGKVAEGIGAFVNPINVAIGGAVGAGVGAIAGATKGFTRIAAVVGAEAVGGVGYTLADHLEKRMSDVNDELTMKSLAIGAAVGGVAGAALHAIGGTFKGPSNTFTEEAIHKVDKETQDLSQFVNSNPDLPLVTKTVSEGLEYNPQNGQGYRVEYNAGPKPELTPVQPELDLGTGAMKAPEDVLTRLGLTKDSEFAIADAGPIARAKALEDSGMSLGDIHEHITYAKNEYEARYSQLLEDAPHDITSHIFNPKNDMNIRRAIAGETEGLSELDIKAGQFYNELNAKLIKEAQTSGVDIGQVDGYIRQVHDTDRMRLVSPQEWADFIQPKLSNDIPREALIKSYEKMLTGDTQQKFTPMIQQKNIKERVFTFKDAQSQVEYEDKFGFKKLIGTHMIDNIQSLKNNIVMNNVIGKEEPGTVLKYLGKLNGLDKKQINSKINFINPSGQSAAPSLWATLTNVGINSSRIFNAILKPAYVFTHLPSDFVTATVQSIGKYGLSNTVKGIFSKGPTSELKYLANLPFEQRETWKNIIGEFKNSIATDHLDFFGITVKDKTKNAIRAAQRSYLKLGGMHMLDSMVRKYALKLATTSIKEEFKLNGLSNLMKGSDINILKKAVNKSGEVVPSRLDEIAKGITDTVEKQKYLDHSTRLKSLYSKTINDCNPIYSPDIFAGMSKYDKTVAAGARSIMWGLKMYKATYGDALKQLISGPNKARALGTLATAAASLSAVELGLGYALHKITGNPEHESSGFPIIDGIVNKAIDKEDGAFHEAANGYAKAMVKNLSTFSAIYSSAVVFGSGPTAAKGIYHWATDDDDETAMNNFKKAMPIIPTAINLWSNISD